MPYVPPGSVTQTIPGVPASTFSFPLGGYTADRYSGDVTMPIPFSINYAPSAVTGNARLGMFLFEPDSSRYPHPKPPGGWPIVLANGGGGWATTPCLPYVVQGFYSGSTFVGDAIGEWMYELLESGVAVGFMAITGNAVGYPSAADDIGTEDWCHDTGAGLIGADHRGYDGPGSPNVGGTSYAKDLKLSYRKCMGWAIQFLRSKIDTDAANYPYDADLIFTAGNSAGSDAAAWGAYNPELADAAMSDFRQYSSRAAGAVCGQLPFFLPGMLQTQKNVYSHMLPSDANPLTQSLWDANTGWALAPDVTSGIVFGVELSIHYSMFGSFGLHWTGAPNNAGVLAHTAETPIFLLGSRLDSFNYGGLTPTQWMAMATLGAPVFRTYTQTNKIDYSGPEIHSPAWQVQAMGALYELDGSSAPGGFHRINSELWIGEDNYAALAGHTTTSDVNAPYSPIDLQELVTGVVEDVEASVDGNTFAQFGFMGAQIARWINQQAERISPGFRTQSLSEPSYFPTAHPEAISVVSLRSEFPHATSVRRRMVQPPVEGGVSWRRQVQSSHNRSKLRRERRAWRLQLPKAVEAERARYLELEQLSAGGGGLLLYRPPEEGGGSNLCPDPGAFDVTSAWVAGTADTGHVADAEALPSFVYGSAGLVTNAVGATVPGYIDCPAQRFAGDGEWQVFSVYVKRPASDPASYLLTGFYDPDAGAVRSVEWTWDGGAWSATGGAGGLTATATIYGGWWRLAAAYRSAAGASVFPNARRLRIQVGIVGNVEDDTGILVAGAMLEDSEGTSSPGDYYHRTRHVPCRIVQPVTVRRISAPYYALDVELEEAI